MKNQHTGHLAFIRCLVIYLHYKNRHDLILLHYKVKLNKGDALGLEAIQSVISDLNINIDLEQIASSSPAIVDRLKRRLIKPFPKARIFVKSATEA